MKPLGGWLAARTDGAPVALRQRVEAYLSATTGPDGADHLMAASRLALGTASGIDAGRSVAIDLLTADALITLSLLHQSEAEPSALAARARTIRLDSRLRD